jgi:hypothetical protein
MMILMMMMMMIMMIMMMIHITSGDDRPMTLIRNVRSAILFLKNPVVKCVSISLDCRPTKEEQGSKGLRGEMGITL